MKIDVVATAQQANNSIVENKTVVVIDVLRATTVMVKVLNNGAKGIIPVLSPDEAFKIKKTETSNVVLGGERNADLIEGFDYGNSPLSYSDEVIKDKLLVMTTTNGTLAIKNSLSAKELLIAAFVNDKAVVDVLKSKEDIVLVCSGNNGLYTLEDALCAGRIIALLIDQNLNIQLSDFALSIHQLYLHSQTDLIKMAAKGYHYNVLSKKGYHKDLEYCFNSDQCKNVPIWNGSMLVNYVRDWTKQSEIKQTSN